MSAAIASLMRGRHALLNAARADILMHEVASNSTSALLVLGTFKTEPLGLRKLPDTQTPIYRHPKGW